MNERIILNKIRTPDGTELISYHRHDYKTYKDKNGKFYSVDGGTSYLRRSFDEQDYEELSIVDDGSLDHETIRNNLYWGTFGIEGDQPLKFVLLKDLDTDHIEAIIDEGYKRVEKYMKVELEWRKNNK